MSEGEGMKRTPSGVIRDSMANTLGTAEPDTAATQAGPHEDSEIRDWSEEHGLQVQRMIHNAPASVYYEYALSKEAGSTITSSGALSVRSGAKTGRSPKDKRIVEEDSTKDDVWWGPVNVKLDSQSFMINRERAVDYLNTLETLYVVDGYAGWDPKYRLKVRVVCGRAYHALFMRNMLIRPQRSELYEFEKPDFTIYNAGAFPANRFVPGMTSSTSVCLSFERNEMVILGTQYAGEMKKGVLTVMMYLMPKRGVLPLHSSCNEGLDGDTTLFFGLSGTGKTTLSADPKRSLIGDDEHVWTDEGCFNIEGGCYAKCIGLKRETEPEIYNAIRFGTVVENVVYDPKTRDVDYDDVSITENTRAAYPLEFIPNVKLPALGTHPSNVILLTCDAFGVLPPVSKLTPEQVMYHFISGYTSKTPGTEDGITEPQVTFSACFGQPFLVWHPTKYAEMLAEKLQEHAADAWLVNTGWTGGKYGVGSRMKLRYTRAMIDAIHDGSLAAAEYETMPVFGLSVPRNCPNVPSDVLLPKNAWADKEDYDRTVSHLADLFSKNFEKYADRSSPEVLAAGPQQ